AEPVDAQGLARHLAVASDPIAQALHAEELAVERPDEDAVQIIDAREVLSLEARGEISGMEVRRLERSLSRRRLLSPEGLHEKSFLPKTRIFCALARLEGEERAGGSHGELGRQAARHCGVTLRDDGIEPDHLTVRKLRSVGGRARTFHADVVEGNYVLERLRHPRGEEPDDA